MGLFSRRQQGGGRHEQGKARRTVSELLEESPTPPATPLETRQSRTWMGLVDRGLGENHFVWFAEDVGGGKVVVRARRNAERTLYLHDALMEMLQFEKTYRRATSGPHRVVSDT